MEARVFSHRALGSFDKYPDVERLGPSLSLVTPLFTVYFKAFFTVYFAWCKSCYPSFIFGFPFHELSFPLRCPQSVCLSASRRAYGRVCHRRFCATLFAAASLAPKMVPGTK